MENGPELRKTADGGGSSAEWCSASRGALSRPVTVSTAPARDAGADAVADGAWYVCPLLR